MFRPRLTASVLGLALALTACSSGKKSESGAPSTRATGSPSPSAAGRGSTDPFCTSLTAYQDKYGGVNTGLSDPQQFKAAMQDAATAIGDADKNAPASIKSDVDVLNKAFQHLLTILQASNFDLSKVSLAQIQPFQTPEFLAASQNVNTYVREHC